MKALHHYECIDKMSTKLSPTGEYLFKVIYKTVVHFISAQCCILYRNKSGIYLICSAN